MNTPQDISKAVAASIPPSATAFDRVFAEMVMALEAGASMPFDLIAEFRESHSPVLSAAFGRFQNTPKLAAIGLRGSMLTGDLSPILIIRQNHAALSTTPGWFELLQDIRTRFANNGPEAIQTLGQIATDGTAPADLRIATAGALARFHTPQTLPYLAALLNDQSAQLRDMAVGGMSGFANNVLIGTHEIAPGAWPYRTDETIAHSGFKGIDSIFWLDWWHSNQTSILRSGRQTPP